MALTNKLTNIADAIRNKTGKTDLLTLDEMPVEIESIQGGGEGLERQEATISSSYVSGFFSNSTASTLDNAWKNTWRPGYYPVFINTLKYTTFNIQGLGELAYGATSLTDHLKGCVLNSTYHGNCSYAFYGCNNLIYMPKITGKLGRGCLSMFSGCYRLKEITNFEDISVSSSLSSTSADYTKKYNCFYNCYALRKVSPLFLTTLGHHPLYYYSSTSEMTNSGYSFYNSTFQNCFSLDEVVGMGTFQAEKSLSNNGFGYHLYHCGRLKRYTFETNEDGTPIDLTEQTYGMYNQTIDFSVYVGYLADADVTKLQTYSPEFTEDTRVTDDATYQALKDNPDYWTTDINYSRYNHDSAVETINSLPIRVTTSVNTLKFKGAQGALTDGGAINTLTEEEVAVAAAKGWTVTLV